MAAPAPPVSIEELKLDLRIDGDEADQILPRLLATAIAWLERETGYVVHARQETFVRDGFDRVVQLDRRPVDPASVELRYFDVAGEELELPGCRPLPLAGWTRVAPPILTGWPQAAAVPGAVMVTATVGHDDASALPADLKGALRIMVGALYRNPDGGEVPDAARQLIDHCYPRRT